MTQQYPKELGWLVGRSVHSASTFHANRPEFHAIRVESRLRGARFAWKVGCAGSMRGFRRKRMRGSCRGGR
jgi:hypothetical protein